MRGDSEPGTCVAGQRSAGPVAAGHALVGLVRLVLPRRPDGTEGYSEEQLAALVTRDTMIGVVPASIPAGKSTP